MATEYCTVADVERLMFANRFTFGANTPLTKTDVEKFINTGEDRVDTITHRTWKANQQRTNILRDIQPDETWSSWGGDYYAGFRLMEYPVKSVDKLELFTSGSGDGYDDITANQGRTSDWFLDSDRGIVYLRAGFMPFVRRNGVRITYTFGETTVPAQIRDATAMLAAWFILQNEDLSLLLPEGAEHLRIQEKAHNWKQEAYEILWAFRRSLVWA